MLELEAAAGITKKMKKSKKRSSVYVASTRSSTNNVSSFNNSGLVLECKLGGCFMGFMVIANRTLLVVIVWFIV